MSRVLVSGLLALGGIFVLAVVLEALHNWRTSGSIFGEPHDVLPDAEERPPP